MSDAHTHTPESFARYLDRVRSSYPFGIPTTAIRTPSSTIQPLVASAVVSFIAVEGAQKLSSEHDALMDSIVSKGLKLPLERTTRRVVTSDDELRTALKEQTAISEVVIILGAREPDGRVEEVGGACVLYSHSLATIAIDPAIKRAFWSHLQTVLGRIT